MTGPACTQEGCQIASTGKCLEGFEPSSTCPYLPDTGAQSPATQQAEQGDYISLPSGEALSEVNASEVTRADTTVVVVLAGPHDSGKTTILTSIFESFLEAPFANYLFSGSSTLTGFERRCHDAREASGRSLPHTVHTPVSDVVDFLHLRLRSASSSPAGRQSILFSDISGERFRVLRDSSEAVKAMKPLRRANHLSVALDGSKLADPMLRQTARNDARSLLRSISEARILSSDCRLEVIFTKWDLVLVSPDQEKIKEFVNDTCSMLSNFRDTFSAISFHHVAARPETKSLPFAHGVANLLRDWLSQPNILPRALYLTKPENNPREFSRFANTVLTQASAKDTGDVKWL
jgi:hypothetical protein